MKVNDHCYINQKNKNIIKFTSEKHIKVMKINEYVYRKNFYQKENLDYHKLQITNIGLYSVAKPDMAKFL